MKIEIFWLTMTVLMTSLFWIPYILNRITEHGLIPALRNPNRDERPKSPWANRMMYAHDNAIENLILFAPLVLTIEMLGIGNDITTKASQVYFFTRLAHYIFYSFGIPYLRTIAFFIGFVVQAVMAVTIISSLS
ncbi:MAG: MAPEG family protein [Cellvibrionaceae bacterium]